MSSAATRARDIYSAALALERAMVIYFFELHDILLTPRKMQ